MLKTEGELIYESDVKELKAAAKAGGRALLDKTRNFGVMISVGLGMRKALVAAVITRIWTREKGNATHDTVMDTVQVMCQIEPSEWTN